MLYLVQMHRHHHTDINGTYHCKRSHNSGVIEVFNFDNYLMAEYHPQTGRVSWQRVVNASQREAVEKWLQGNYPATPVAEPVRAAKKKAKK